ncbi:unnamed protein product [Adineta steineri]|uniref:Uncharacterized protein n=1 Tax=Adineta steineri TaxID=433720 RepID=A0A814FX33_9BILA|nr:unnamed protein product [Adineta steineri]CAF3670693.1 unnamed protein product [Adineta steineri]
MSENCNLGLELEYFFKMLIVGDSGVGKTSLCKRFTYGDFSTDYITTTSVDFKIRLVEINEKLCQLQLWDFSNDDRFKSYVSRFYRTAHGVMICFDITNEESFLNVDNWLQEVIKLCPEQIPVFLVGTKSDLQSERTVSYTTIKAYADKHQLPYMETSSKTNENTEIYLANFTRALVSHVDQITMKRENKSTGGPTVVINNETKPVQKEGSKCTI